MQKVIADVFGVVMDGAEIEELALLLDPYNLRLIDGTAVMLQLCLMACQHGTEVLARQLQETYNARHPAYVEVANMLQKVIKTAGQLDYCSLEQYACSWDPAGASTSAAMDLFDFKQEVKTHLRLDLHSKDLNAARFFYGGGETSISVDVFMADLLRRAYCAQLNMKDEMMQMVESTAATDGATRDGSTNSQGFDVETIDSWSANNNAGSMSAPQQIQRLASEHLNISLRLQEAVDVHRWLKTDDGVRRNYVERMLLDAIGHASSVTSPGGHARNHAEEAHATLRLVLKVAIAAIRQIPLNRQLQANAKVLLSATELRALQKRKELVENSELSEVFDMLARKVMPNDEATPSSSSVQHRWLTVNAWCTVGACSP